MTTCSVCGAETGIFGSTYYGREFCGKCKLTHDPLYQAFAAAWTAKGEDPLVASRETWGCPSDTWATRQWERESR